MKKPNQVRRNVKNTITAAQAKKRLAIGTGVPLDFPSPCITLIPAGNDGVAEEAIDLSASEYAALKRAGARGGAGVLMFMANAALDKIAATPQPKTNASKKKAANGNHTAGVVTCVLLEPNGREWARVKFPRDVFARIEAAARKLNITLPQFFENALLHYMELQMGRRSA